MLYEQHAAHAVHPLGHVPPVLCMIDMKLPAAVNHRFPLSTCLDYPRQQVLLTRICDQKPSQFLRGTPSQQYSQFIMLDQYHTT